MSALEKEVENVFRQRVKKMGWLCIKMNAPHMYKGETGWPDRICISPYGLHVWVEIKREKGKLTGNQVRRIAELRRHSVLVIVVHGMEEMYALAQMMKEHDDAHRARP